MRGAQMPLGPLPLRVWTRGAGSDQDLWVGPNQIATVGPNWVDILSET